MPTPTNAISIHRNEYAIEVLNKEESLRKRLFVPEYPGYCLNRLPKVINATLSHNKITITVNHTLLLKELSHIQEVIDESEYILSLKNDWDSEGALEIPKHIFDRAINFIKSYSNYIFENYEVVIDAPNISPLKDGSIDLSWNSESANLLINIKNTKNDIAFYYGELFIDNEQILDINGQITTTSPIDKFASWFTNLPKMEKEEYSY